MGQSQHHATTAGHGSMPVELVIRMTYTLDLGVQNVRKLPIDPSNSASHSSSHQLTSHMHMAAATGQATATEAGACLAGEQAESGR